MIFITIPSKQIQAELQNIKGYIPHFITNLIYRIKNLFKAIVGKSDWQISEQKIYDLIVKPEMNPHDISCVKVAITNIMNDYLAGIEKEHSFKMRLSGFVNMSVTFVL